MPSPFASPFQFNSPVNGNVIQTTDISQFIKPLTNLASSSTLATLAPATLPLGAGLLNVNGALSYTTGILSAGTATSFGSAPQASACDPTGNYFFLAGGTSLQAYTISSAGALTALGSALTTGTAPYALAADPSGRYLYLVNQGSNTIQAYSIATTGLTAIGGTVATGTGPQGVACDPSGRFVYVTNTSGNSIQAYSIGSTGALTAVGSAITTNVNAPFGIACDPTGRFVYVANSGSATILAYTIGTTGALTVIGTTTAAGTTPQGIACDPTGRYVYVANNGAGTIQPYSINGTTGAPTGLATVSLASVYKLVVDPNGRFVYAITTGTTVNLQPYTIGPTGTLTAFGSATTVGGASPSPKALSGDPTGRFLFVASTGANNYQPFTVSLSTITPQTKQASTGGGSAPTLGANAIGVGGGPATAAQNCWQPVTLSDGTTGWVPVWK